jgi:hypothetical protein
MCGRYVRARAGLDYVVPLMADRDVRVPDDDRPGWNIAPSTRQLVNRLQDAVKILGNELASFS